MQRCVLDTLNTLIHGVPENDNNAMGATSSRAGRMGQDQATSPSFYYTTKTKPPTPLEAATVAAGWLTARGEVRSAFTLTNVTGDRPDEARMGRDGSARLRDGSRAKEAAGQNPELAQNVFVVKWAKGSYGPKWPPRYFEKRGFPVRVRKADGAEYDRSVVAAVQFTPTTSAAADSRSRSKTRL